MTQEKQEGNRRGEIKVTVKVKKDRAKYARLLVKCEKTVGREEFKK